MQIYTRALFVSLNRNGQFALSKLNLTCLVQHLFISNAQILVYYVEHWHHDTLIHMTQWYTWHRNTEDTHNTLIHMTPWYRLYHDNRTTWYTETQIQISAVDCLLSSVCIFSSLYTDSRRRFHSPNLLVMNPVQTCKSFCLSK